jgi:hypothetical protein
MTTAKTFADALKECMTALGGIRTKAEISAWIDAHYKGRWKANTLVGHLYGCCVNNPKGIQHHPGFPRFLYTHGNGRYETYDPAKHGQYSDHGFPAGEQEEEDAVAGDSVSDGGQVPNGVGECFAYEAHLRDYLARNIEILEPGLSLWVPDSELQSVEYDIDGRRIDILARDSRGIPVIIELKVSRGHEKTVGQCALYRAKLKKTLKLPKVRLMIVAQELTDDLKLAASELSDVDLYEYSLSMAVTRVLKASKTEA